MTRLSMPPGEPLGTLLTGLAHEPLEAALAASTRRHYPAGTALFHQGDAPAHLLQISAGLVKVVQINPAGAQTTMHILGAGELVGCVAVVQEFPFPATAIASLHTSALSWTVAQATSLMQLYPPLAANILKEVGSRVQEMAERLIDTLHNGVEQRIARVLLRLAAIAGQNCAEGIRLQGPITRRDIAELSGATYFTVSRVLSGWQKLGIVANGRERILIMAPERLTQIAGPVSFGA